MTVTEVESNWKSAPREIRISRWGSTYRARKVNRRLLKRRDQNICWLCKKFVPDEEFSRDHIKPQFLGGTDEWNNISLAHKTCNNNRNHDDYLEMWPRVVEELDRLSKYGNILQAKPLSPQQRADEVRKCYKRMKPRITENSQIRVQRIAAVRRRIKNYHKAKDGSSFSGYWV